MRKKSLKTKIMAVALTFAMAFSVISPFGVTANVSKAANTLINSGEKTPVFGPRMSADGTTVIWDTITFGSYKQTADSSKLTPITWRVLSVEDNKALLISDKVLAVMAYGKTATSWVSSDIYKWLNDTFITDAFKNKDGDVSAALLPINGCYATIFSEADLLKPAYGFAKDAKCRIANKTGKVSTNAWWLQDVTPVTKNDKTTYQAKRVTANGNIELYAVNDKRGIRPVIKIDLNKDSWANAGTIDNARKAVKHFHNMVKISSTEGNCVEKGHIEYICDSKENGCTTSGYFKYIEYTSTNPDNHKGAIVTVNRKDATEIDNGYTGDRVCKSCGAVVERGMTIPALNKRVSQKITNRKLKKSYSYKTLKSWNIIIKLNAKTTGDGDLKYKVISTPKKAKKFIKVSKTGKVTLKKGAKKGKYKIRITARQTARFIQEIKTITIKVK